MKILLLGDSLFARYEGKEIPHISHSLLQLSSGLSITNWAVSGDNSIDLLKHLSERELPQVEQVFVFIGANDLAQHKQVFLGEYEDNLKQIVARLQEMYPTQAICLLTPSPVDEVKQAYRTNRLVGYYGDVVKKVAEQTGVAMLDTVAAFAKSPLGLETLLVGSMDDGLHFGSAAYDLLASELFSYLHT